MKGRTAIGLLCSVQQECGEIVALIHAKRRVTAGTTTFISGTMNGLRTTLGITGIGKVNAAHGCGMLINRYRPHCIINFGIGGSYRQSGLSVGDVAVAEKEIYADEGVVNDRGFAGMNAIGVPVIASSDKKIFNELPADATLLRRLKNKAWNVTFGIAYGSFLTVSSVSGTPGRANELHDRFGGICENMEGAAIFHIARIYNVPCLAVRGISNSAGVRDRKHWDIEKAAKNCQLIVRESAGRLNRP